jgi:hypothetical protein
VWPGSEGTGGLPLRLDSVHTITTGENTGVFTEVFHGTLIESVHFTPWEIIGSNASFLATLTQIDITRA